jgi:acetyltransferase-like isoleucine patch superfamily enzyme
VNIKKGVILTPDVLIDYIYPYLITIEDGVCISPRSSIFAHAKASEHLMENYIRPRIKSVLIKKHAWLGAGCVILPGVTIGEGAVVISNSVVVVSVPDYTMVGGIPARPLKKLRPFKEKTGRDDNE